MTVDNTEVLPLLDDRGFDAAMRGYDRRQVDMHLARLDDEIRAAANERDAALNRSADLAAQLASSQAQIESLRRQLRAATERVTEDNVDPKAQVILDAAQRDADKLRAEAQAIIEEARVTAEQSSSRVLAAARLEAEQIKAEATERLAEADATFRRRVAEAERLRDEAFAEAARNLAQTQAEEDRLTQEAEAARVAADAASLAERTRLERESAELIAANEAASASAIREADAAALLARQTATEDFDIALRLRRSKEAEFSAQQLAQAQAEVDQLITEATGKADVLDHYAAALHRNLSMFHSQFGELIASAPQPTVRQPHTAAGAYTAAGAHTTDAAHTADGS